jgi:8-oxo-dGTP pyrophosphatase MutT (NUDIX family)
MKSGVDYPGISVVFVCHDGQGNYLLHKRSEQCRDERGRWDTGGGGMEFGDTIETTLKKEVGEEYGTEPLEWELLGYREVFRENNGVTTHWIAFDFRVLIDREKAYLAEPHMADEIGWFRIGEFPEHVHSQLPKTLEKYPDAWK